MASCTFCGERIAFKTVYADKRSKFPTQGAIQEGQATIMCFSCRRLMHTDCVREHGSEIPGSHLLFADGHFADSVSQRQLAGDDIAFCGECFPKVRDQIAANYREAGRGEDAVRFLAELENNDPDDPE